MSLTRDFPDLPPVWMLGGVALEWALARWVPLVRLGDWSAPLGWALVALGFALIAWSAVWFARKRTSIEPGDVPKALIVEGPYRINRNPIYAGMALGLLGIALILGALSALLVPPLFVWIVTRRFVRGEEAALRAAFGAEADDYIARTRRW